MNCWFRQPHITTPRNKNRFLGIPVKRGANDRCAYGAGDERGCAGQQLENATPGNCYHLGAGAAFLCSTKMCA
jgi:hypothetical protein